MAPAAAGHTAAQASQREQAPTASGKAAHGQQAHASGRTLAATSRVAKPASPATSTPARVTARSPPTSRRITRSGGTLRQLQHRRQAKRRQQGQAHAQAPQRRPAAMLGGSSRVEQPRQQVHKGEVHRKTQGRAQAAGQQAHHRELDARRRPAMARCGAPSTRSMAQSSRWRWAKSRAAMATATAASRADSKRHQVQKALGPGQRLAAARAGRLRSASTRRPRSVPAIHLGLGPAHELAHAGVLGAAPGVGGRHGQAVGHPAGGLHQAAWPARSSACSITRGAKPRKPAPRSGSCTIRRVMVSRAVAQQQRIAQVASCSAVQDGRRPPRPRHAPGRWATACTGALCGRRAPAAGHASG